jgi:hypothetical protein
VFFLDLRKCLIYDNLLDRNGGFLFFFVGPAMMKKTECRPPCLERSFSGEGGTLKLKEGNR